ncbi:hypothetical protein P8452_77343 [Trifolium repens]|nr:hypothetical protein P8452_77343 [Trifolium repens]
MPLVHCRHHLFIAFIFGRERVARRVHLCSSPDVLIICSSRCSSSSPCSVSSQQSSVSTFISRSFKV